MKKLIGILVIILLLITNLSFVCTSEKSNQKRTIYVDDDNTMGPWDGSLEHPYQFIHNAIDNASDYDKIFVNSGFYQEDIIIDKSIDLIGENRQKTIIDGMKNNGSNALIIFKTDSITFSNFTVQNSKAKNESSAIHVESAYNHIISNNFLNNSYGIKINSIFSTIKDNTFINNSCAIFGNSCGYDIIDNKITNIITNYSSKGLDNFGILLEGSIYNNIQNNIINHTYCAIYLGSTGSNNIIGSESNNIIGNDCQRNENGIYLSGSSNTIIKQNILNEYQNGDLNGVGIDIQYYSNNNEISHNDIQTFDKAGIFIAMSFNNTIIKNNLINNQWFGVSSYDSENNSIHENNIFNNGRNAFFSCSNNSWDKNYWGKEKIFPKLILGYTFKSLFGKNYKMYLLHYDWHPAKEPYEI